MQHTNNTNEEENNNPSTGEILINKLYKKDKTKEAPKKNSQPINVKMDKDDLEIIEYLAEKFGVSRNWLISSIIESNIDEMFDAFEYKPRYQLATIADGLITKKNLPHEHRGETWMQELRIIDPCVFNPSEKGL